MMERARSDRRVVSADTDFGDLLAAAGSTEPSIVLFRGRAHAPTDLAQALLAVLPEIGDDRSPVRSWSLSGTVRA